VWWLVDNKNTFLARDIDCVKESIFYGDLGVFEVMVFRTEVMFWSGGCLLGRNFLMK